MQGVLTSAIGTDLHPIDLAARIDGDALVGHPGTGAQGEGTPWADDGGLNVQKTVDIAHGKLLIEAVLMGYWFTSTLTTTSCTAPASFAAIWMGTEIRAARSAGS